MLLLQNLELSPWKRGCDALRVAPVLLGAVQRSPGWRTAPISPILGCDSSPTRVCLMWRRFCERTAGFCQGVSVYFCSFKSKSRSKILFHPETLAAKKDLFKQGKSPSGCTYSMLWLSLCFPIGRVFQPGSSLADQGVLMVGFILEQIAASG